MKLISVTLPPTTARESSEEITKTRMLMRDNASADMTSVAETLLATFSFLC